MTSYLADRLPPIPNPDPHMWVDEAIWGHRYHDEQSPWLIFLEFLNVYEHERRKGRALQEVDGFNRLKYRPARRLYLRNILFNNPKIDYFSRQNLGDQYRWKMWLHEMTKAQGVNDPRFDYLQERFDDFNSFVEVVRLLRSTSLELHTNKRWSSKFVFPYGPDCLYEDLNKDAKSNDRNFFGRTGEMLYLMLSRSREKDELNQLLQAHAILQPGKWNAIVKALQPTEEEVVGSELGKSFLAYPTHPTFDAIAADWISLLKLDMPGYDVLPHLVNTAAFHLIQYQLRVSRDLVGLEGPLKMVCEVVAPKKTLIREVSCALYQENNLLSSRAVMSYIDQIETSDEWQQAKGRPGAFAECRQILRDRVLWGDDGYDGASHPDDLIKELRGSAKRRHQQHAGNIHRNYGREIGLISRRGTVKLRYAPTDDFLKSLLFANITKRMELHQLLALLWQRYGLIFGDREGEAVLPKDEFDKKAFQANARRLEHRLGSLGVLKRLSDGCAYVINPYSRREP